MKKEQDTESGKVSGKKRARTKESSKKKATGVDKLQLQKDAEESSSESIVNVGDLHCPVPSVKKSASYH